MEKERERERGGGGGDKESTTNRKIQKNSRNTKRNLIGSSCDTNQHIRLFRNIFTQWTLPASKCTWKCEMYINVWLEMYIASHSVSMHMLGLNIASHSVSMHILGLNIASHSVSMHMLGLNIASHSVSMHILGLNIASHSVSMHMLGLNIASHSVSMHMLGLIIVSALESCCSIIGEFMADLHCKTRHVLEQDHRGSIPLRPSSPFLVKAPYLFCVRKLVQNDTNDPTFSRMCSSNHLGDSKNVERRHPMPQNFSL